jgi:apolipoprotein N-acyltransferase
LKRFSHLLFAAGSGLLLWASWPVSKFTFLVFFAWIPLLWIETKVTSRKKFFGLTYITMFVWNVATTWWIWNASVPGAISAFLANSLLMCVPWMGFKIAKKWLGENAGYFALAAFWMCFEYIHLQDWGLSWPWLTLGNAFSTHPEWIQWYEYTGTSGGTCWILAVNILLFLHVKKNYNRTTARTNTNILSAVLVLIFPVALSYIIKSKLPKPEGRLHEVVIVQPNIDPYEKISAGTFESQLQKLIRLSEQGTGTDSALVVWPETALYTGNGIDEKNMQENFFLTPLWSFLKKQPDISLFTGVESYRQFDSATRYTQEFDGNYYESYNGAVLLDSGGAEAFYHKSMLVPGVETLPWFLKFIDKWFEKFGGTTAGYAKQTDRTVLKVKNGIKIAPAICYESIYGEYMSQYIRNGANLICIITNDGWWKKTPGHQQHMNYARLRAIETRTWVARSANTGISCFIDPAGIVLDPQPYNTMSVIKLSIPIQNVKKTFFVRNGDLLSKVMSILSVILITWIIVLKIRRLYLNKTITKI